MRDFRLSLAQIRPRLGNVDANLVLHHQYVERALAERSDVVVFPEQSLTGYFLSDLVSHVALRRDDPAFLTLRELSRDIAIVFGFVEESADHRYLAAAAYLHRGAFVHVHHKVYLVTYGLFDEARDLAAGESLRAFDTEVGRQAMLICEDLWHASAASVVTADGADVILGLSSSPGRGLAGARRALGSAETWRTLNKLYAQLFACYTVHCNRVGYEDGVNFWGGSEVVGPDGESLARAPEFDEALVSVQLTDRELRRQRTRLPLRRDENVALTQRELARIAAGRAALPHG
ncbi:MAG: carbon-nitrogen hydrolase [Actinobacteria bacterium]|nr:carbon-nitrogen hydrolase [Actinomycetota bacterium]